MKILGVVGSARKQSRSGVYRQAVTAAMQQKMMEMMEHSA